MGPAFDTLMNHFAELLSAILVVLSLIAFLQADVAKQKKSVFWKGFSLALFLLAISSIVTILESFFLSDVLNAIEHICNALAGAFFAWHIYVRFRKLGSFPHIYEL